MSEIIDKVLVSKKSIPEIPKEWENTPMVKIVFELIKNDCNRDWLIDANTNQIIQTNEIEKRSLQVADNLSRKGFSLGQTIHIILPNSVDFHVTAFGIWLLGGIVSVADPSLNKNIIEQQIIDTKSKMIVCMKKDKEKIQTIKGKKFGFPKKSGRGFGFRNRFLSKKWEIKAEFLHFQQFYLIKPIKPKYAFSYNTQTFCRYINCFH